MKRNIQLLLVTLLISFIIIEIVFRINGKYQSYSERSWSGDYISPFQTDDYGWAHTLEPFSEKKDVNSEFTTHWVANNEGLNDKKLSIKKEGKRVMVFGDSFTEGVGAPNDSSCPRILESLLRANFDSTTQVINCGNSAADIFTEYKLLTGKMLKYQPDYVLVIFNASDVQEFIVRGGFERFIGNNELQYRKAPWYEPLYARSFIVRRIVHDVYKYDYGFLTPEENILMNDSAYKMIAQAIDSFQNLCNGRQIKFGMVLHPIGGEIMVPSCYKMDRLINHCKQNGVAYVDELQYLEQNNIDSIARTAISWPKDGHFNSKGYELLARCAYGLFKE